MENNIKPESQNAEMAVAGLAAAYDCFTALQTFAPAVANIAKICTDAIARGNKVMFCGIGWTFYVKSAGDGVNRVDG